MVQKFISKIIMKWTNKRIIYKQDNTPHQRKKKKDLTVNSPSATPNFLEN